MSKFKFALSVLSLILVSSLSAQAATRRVYFSQSGRNLTTNGVTMGDVVRSSCKISLSNSSGQDQTYTVSINASSRGPLNPSTDVAATLDATVSSALTGTLTTGGNATFVYNYEIYPDRNTVQAGSQELICSGNIIITDATATPGFVVANGVIITFVESGSLQTTGVTGAAAFGGLMVFSQVPISINSGRPL